MPEEELRELFHRMIAMPLWSDWLPYQYLFFLGDESSVPLIINAMRWAPEPQYDPAELKTQASYAKKLQLRRPAARKKVPTNWREGFRALEHITFQPLPPSHSVWDSWYQTNKHNSRFEWIIHGFNLRGVPLKSRPDTATINLLLEQLAVPDDYDTDDIRFIDWDRNQFHALWLLENADYGLVSNVVMQASELGTVPQRRGLARYCRTIPDTVAPSERLLNRLTKDEDRMTRILAAWARTNRIKATNISPYNR